MRVFKAFVFAFMIFLFGCDPTPGGGEDGGSTFDRPTLNLADLPIKVDWQIPSPTACLEPRPDDIGCTTLCKPCKTWFCTDGEWVPHDISTPDFICDPPTSGFGDDPFACPKSPEGFCPAECSFCY